MGSDTPYPEPFYTPNEGNNVAGYIAFYLKRGEPIKGDENEITEIPLTLEKKIIPPILKEGFEKHFLGVENRIPTEEELNKWLESIEKCISCGVETPYTINTHIDMRKNYIEGAGQLCAGCYEKIYNKK